MNKSAHYMKMAIAAASNAKLPFGAVIVQDDKVLACVGSVDSPYPDPTAHAEMTAIREACKTINSFYLKDCTLYASCEPCAMCMTAAWYAGIRRIVIGSTIKDLSFTQWPWGLDIEMPKTNVKAMEITLEKSSLHSDVMEMYKAHPMAGKTNWIF